MKPRLSMATTFSTLWPPQSTTSRSRAWRNAAGSLSRVVMSLKTIPFFGKSGTSRIAAFSASMRSCRFMSPSLADVESVIAPGGHRRALDAFDVGEAGSVAELRLEVSEDRLGRLPQHFHRPVGQVPGKAVDAQGLRSAQGEVAEADTLDSAPYEIAVGCHLRFPQRRLSFARRARSSVSWREAQAVKQFALDSRDDPGVGWSERSDDARHSPETSRRARGPGARGAAHPGAGLRPAPGPPRSRRRQLHRRLPAQGALQGA